MSVHEIDYNFPIEVLNQEFEKVFPKRELIGESLNMGLKGFYLLPPTDLMVEIAIQCVTALKIPYPNYIINFLYVEPNITLPWHCDAEGSISALNVNIGESREPIEFEDQVYHYKAALVDTSKRHRVSNGPHPRRIFRITFHDEEATFENVKRAILQG